MVARDRWSNVSVAAYVGAGALAVATLAYWLWPTSDSASSGALGSIRPVPMIGEGTEGLQLVGSF
jgi:hypothetical protein